MDNQDFNTKYRDRTKNFTVELLKATSTWGSRTEEIRVIKKQIIRSGTSMAANFRATTRARSHREYYAKLSIVVEETDETLFWLDILEETGILPNFDLTALKDEITELLKVFAKTRKTAKQH